MASPLSGFSVDESYADPVASAAVLLERARRVLVITGAGMSADSGLPTYRGVGGLYEGEVTEDGVAIEDALSAEMFARDPALTWKYIAQMELACRGAAANDGHQALAAMEGRFERFCVLTQNVDGFHADAGSVDVIAMHGDIHRLDCTACGARVTVSDYSALTDLPPACAACGGMLRPATILFGEMLPLDAVARYEQALAEGFDLVMAVGTTAVFPYIAAPVREAWVGGGATVEINPTATEISPYCHVTIRASAAATLVELGRRMQAADSA